MREKINNLFQHPGRLYAALYTAGVVFAVGYFFGLRSNSEYVAELAEKYEQSQRLVETTRQELAEVSGSIDTLVFHFSDHTVRIPAESVATKDRNLYIRVNRPATVTLPNSQDNETNQVLLDYDK